MRRINLRSKKNPTSAVLNATVVTKAELRNSLPKGWPHRFFTMSLTHSNYAKSLAVLLVLQARGIKFTWHSWNIIVIATESDTLTIQELKGQIDSIFDEYNLTENDREFLLTEPRVKFIEIGQYSVPYPEILGEKGSEYQNHIAKQYYDHPNVYRMNKEQITAICAAAAYLPATWQGQTVNRIEIIAFSQDKIDEIIEQNNAEQPLGRCKKQKQEDQCKNCTDLLTIPTTQFPSELSNLTEGFVKEDGAIEFMITAIVSDIVGEYLNM